MLFRWILAESGDVVAQIDVATEVNPIPRVGDHIRFEDGAEIFRIQSVLWDIPNQVVEFGVAGLEAWDGRDHPTDSPSSKELADSIREGFQQDVKGGG